MCELKRPLTYDEQVERLKAHGCAIDDVAACREFLTKVNYYRFSAYFLPFKNETGDYDPGTTFETARNIYEFDRKLRCVLFRALGVERHRNAQSWLRCCSDLRNICAHQGRLYYRSFSAIPANLNVRPGRERTLWAAMLALKALFPSKAEWNGETIPALKALLAEYGAHIDLAAIGFPEDWEASLKKE